MSCGLRLLLIRAAGRHRTTQQGRQELNQGSGAVRRRTEMKCGMMVMLWAEVDGRGKSSSVALRWSAARRFNSARQSVL